ncbi:molecular chaperone of HSP90 family protein, partial [Candidatus Bathyarchaeota archaeon]|nr:molecular chaperone of HSP90 family protein [Candidatus Bathyarchaeota archaeon]
CGDCIPWDSEWLIMVSTLCDRIREENKRKYGTHVSVYGPVLLANLYSDRTHFLYELLQNAEDACERARKKGHKGKFYISFKLYPDRLEVRHNGIPFDENDVKGICGIVEATKDKDTLQIGKFGIGFKSVYAYTTSPEVHSEKEICHSCIKCAFRIQDYVHPYPIKLREDVRAGETLFVMRFYKEVREVAYSEIEGRLRNLGIRTLLFLNNLEEVSYKTESCAGKYSRCSKAVNDARQVSLHYVEEAKKQTEKWLILDRSLGRDKTRRMEIAFLLANDP